MTAPDFASELAYWARELSLQGDYREHILDRSAPERMHKEFPFDIMPLITELAARLGQSPRVLDVGSGPLSMLGYGHQFGSIVLTCADPLAEAYKTLLRRYGYHVPYSLVQVAGEELSRMFPRDLFDLVWIHNALDHTQDPCTVMKEMVKVLKPAGYLVVQSWVREGTAEGWTGLHQHDLFIADGGMLMCESRGGESSRGPLCISEDLALKVIECTPASSTPRAWLKIVWRKTHNTTGL